MSMCLQFLKNREIMDVVQINKLQHLGNMGEVILSLRFKKQFLQLRLVEQFLITKKITFPVS